MKGIKRNIFTVFFALVLALSFTLMPATPAYASAVTATGSGDWNSTTVNAPWPGGVVPAATDTVVIPSPFTVTLQADTTIAGLTVDSGGKLAFGVNNINFTVNGDVSGAGQIQPVGGVIIKLTGDWNFSGTYSNLFLNVYFTGSGDQTIPSTATATWRTMSNALKTSGTIFIGTTPTLTFSTQAQLYNGTGVSYNRAGDQLVLPVAYNNLTLAGSGNKTTTGVSLDGIFSMEGTATASAVPTYGSLAGLQYNTATARTASIEWVTPFAATGGVTIANTGTITLDAA
ncbi:MAG: hypothetical protein Q7S81_01850, partial [bacterium]|nr:hypothetical protein [bacterium]